MIRICLLALAACAAFAARAQAQETIPVVVPAGAPLRMYLTQRLPKKLNQPVHAKLLEPVFAFDREVIPAGSEISGHVSRLVPAPKMQRVAAMVGGDFTPLRRAEVIYTDVTFPGGRHMSLSTRETEGLASVYVPPRPQKSGKKRKAAPANPGVVTTAKDQVKTQINSAISARTRGLIEVVRAPDKKDKLEEYLLSRLPYHPQWVKKNTRFDAELDAPLQFGEAPVNAAKLTRIGTQPPSDSIVHARLLTALDSNNATKGDKVEAVVSQPLFAPDSTLLLPAGTRLTGRVTLAHRARWFHRGGQLRFNFQQIELPENLRRFATVEPAIELRTVATLDGAEGSGKTAIKVDPEGGVKAVEPKTRFIAPVLAVLVAGRAMDNDAGRHHASGGAVEGNAGARTLGGISGFGLIGAGIAQSSHYVSSALSIYGMGWQVYSNIVARGGEVEFQKNAAVDIRFGSRKTQVPVSKFARTF